MQPKLTVVVPVYKVEPYLRRCLNSIVDQTCRDLEILLIDDGSPDGCGAICDEYAARDGRIRVIHKQNAGVGAARNDGIRLATGEWITFVDSDDWLDVEYYQKMLTDAPPVDVICSLGYIEEFPSKTAVQYVFPEPFVDIKGEKRAMLIAKAWAPHCTLVKHKDLGANVFVWNKLYKTSFLRQVPPLDESLHPMEDILYSVQVFIQAKSVAVSDSIGYHYRQLVPTASTSRFNPAWPQMFAVCEKRMEDIFASQEPSALLADAFYAREMESIGYLLKCYHFHPENPAPYKQTAAEIRGLKKRPCVAAAMNRASNRLLSKKQIVLKFALRLPWVWPLKLLTAGRQYLRRAAGI